MPNEPATSNLTRALISSPPQLVLAHSRRRAINTFPLASLDHTDVRKGFTMYRIIQDPFRSFPNLPHFVSDPFLYIAGLPILNQLTVKRRRRLSLLRT